MSKVKHGIGIAMFIAGLLTVESETMLIPLTLIAIGTWLIRDVMEA